MPGEKRHVKESIVELHWLNCLKNCMKCNRRDRVAKVTRLRVTHRCIIRTQVCAGFWE